MYQFSIWAGVAVMVLPLIFGLSWVLFWLIYNHKEETRLDRIKISCILVVGGMIFLGMYGSHRYELEPFNYCEMFDGGVTIILGWRWWGKPKGNPIPLSDDTDPG